jgi:hypothetical protein
MSGAPDRLPSSHHDYPRHVKRELARRLVEKQVEVQDGWNGVIEWLYRGSVRPTGEQVSYVAKAADLWKFVVEDAEAMRVERAKGDS